MKIKPVVVLFSVLSFISFSTVAMDVINKEQSVNRQSIGTISIDAIGSSPTDMNEAINKKAQEQGASAYRIIEARTGDNWHVTVELYK
ncbi:DUF1471 domain-containing protein [Klebsiella variicola]|uniref:YdgH/BhsA/McbA-like domain containing protein n=1 Tax=Klebsiella variicola TaxID=244366 RepID=UPI0012DFB87C|nr:YdgH/BhsA/McbA-like domain containing protein [Klebsiella variicola]MUM52702.1 DUF1471 domain-containing protein [Klebsiella variicola]MUM58113.1 DUF1471 domain-containing protein [Klebsiella variicola]